MDPQVMEQMAQELALVLALGEHDDPEGLFGMAKLKLGGQRLGAHYALQQDAWGLAA